MFNMEAMILLVNIIFLHACSLGYVNKKEKSFWEGESHYIWIKDYENKHFFFFLRIACSKGFGGIWEIEYSCIWVNPHAVKDL